MDRKYHKLLAGGLIAAIIVIITAATVTQRSRTTTPASAVAVATIEKSSKKSDQTPIPPENPLPDREEMPIRATAPPDKQDNTLDFDTEKETVHQAEGERVQRVLAIRNTPSEENIALLTAYLDDTSSAVVSEAIDSLGHLAMKSEFTEIIFGILLQKATDEVFPERGEALVTAAMLEMDEQLLSAIPGFLSEKGIKGESDRYLAVRALSFVKSSEKMPYIEQIINTSRLPQTLHTAYGILAKTDTVESFELLENKLASTDPIHQRCSTWALSRANSPEYNHILADALSGGELQKASIAVLAQSPSAAEVFSEVLTDSYLEKEKKIDYLNVIASNTMSAPDEVKEPMKELLANLLASEDKDIKINAISALGKIGGKEDTATLLAPELQSKDSDIRENAFFSYIAYTSPRTYKPLLDLLWDNNEKIRRGAMVVAMNFVNESDSEQLNRALKHNDEFIRKNAEQMLNGL